MTSPDVPAAEPSGSLSLAEAIEMQLSRKSEFRTRPIKVLVIDPPRTDCGQGAAL
jgi:hypothetical protein